MIGAYSLICTGDETDTFGRLVAVCTVSGIDVGRQMVADGWATAFRRYSEIYVAEETRARASRLGLWASSFTPPETFRAAQDTAETEQPRTMRQARAAVAGRDRLGLPDQGQSQPPRRVDLSLAGKALLRRDTRRGDVLHRGASPGGRLPPVARPVTPAP